MADMCLSFEVIALTRVVTAGDAAAADDDAMLRTVPGSPTAYTGDG